MRALKIIMTAARFSALISLAATFVCYAAKPIPIRTQLGLSDIQVRQLSGYPLSETQVSTLQREVLHYVSSVMPHVHRSIEGGHPQISFGAPIRDKMLNERLWAGSTSVVIHGGERVTRFVHSGPYYQQLRGHQGLQRIDITAEAETASNLAGAYLIGDAYPQSLGFGLRSCYGGVAAVKMLDNSLIEIGVVQMPFIRGLNHRGHLAQLVRHDIDPTQPPHPSLTFETYQGIMASAYEMFAAAHLNVVGHGGHPEPLQLRISLGGGGVIQSVRSFDTTGVIVDSKADAVSMYREGMWVDGSATLSFLGYRNHPDADNYIERRIIGDFRAVGRVTLPNLR